MLWSYETLWNTLVPCIPNSVSKIRRYALDIYLSMFQRSSAKHVILSLPYYGRENSSVTVSKQLETTMILNAIECLL